MSHPPQRATTGSRLLCVLSCWSLGKSNPSRRHDHKLISLHSHSHHIVDYITRFVATQIALLPWRHYVVQHY